MKIYTIDGNRITSLSELYFEFARAVDAPNGYFGKCLQSFDDCLFGGFGLETPCIIVWKNSKVSRTALNSAALVEICLALMNSSINEPGMEEGKSWILTTFAEAQWGRKTLFDEVVDLIESVPSRATWDHQIELQLK